MFYLSNTELRQSTWSATSSQGNLKAIISTMKILLSKHLLLNSLPSLLHRKLNDGGNDQGFISRTYQCLDMVGAQ